MNNGFLFAASFMFFVNAAGALLAVFALVSSCRLHNALTLRTHGAA